METFGRGRVLYDFVAEPGDDCISVLEGEVIEVSLRKDKNDKEFLGLIFHKKNIDHLIAASHVYIDPFVCVLWLNSVFGQLKTGN